VLYLAGLIVAIAIITKLIGCGIPSMLFLKDKGKAMKVGIGMISRGEIGLIIAGVGVSSGVFGFRYLYLNYYYGCCNHNHYPYLA
jgi:Kef-type K+ transport system membrane component KefB